MNGRHVSRHLHVTILHARTIVHIRLQILGPPFSHLLNFASFLFECNSLLHSPDSLLTFFYRRIFKLNSQPCRRCFQTMYSLHENVNSFSVWHFTIVVGFFVTLQLFTPPSFTAVNDATRCLVRT